MSDVYCTLDLDQRLTYASPEYFAATMRDDSIIGMNLFDAFPYDPEAASDEQILRASFDEVQATRKPVAMPIQRYDIERPMDGELEVRYWRVVNSPILEGKAITGYMLSIVDVTRQTVDAQQQAYGAQIARNTKRIELGRVQSIVLYTFIALATVVGFVGVTNVTHRVGSVARQTCERQNVTVAALQSLGGIVKEQRVTGGQTPPPPSLIKLLAAEDSFLRLQAAIPKSPKCGP